MPWVEVFSVFLVCHLVGDFLLQTDWQAMHKRGGLGRDKVARRALVSHVATYTLAFVPALIWLAGPLGIGVLGIAALVAVPHLIQDDGRLIAAYFRSVKHTDPQRGDNLAVAVDQSFHVATLFLVGLIAGT